jgi:hypothetical protein
MPVLLRTLLVTLACLVIAREARADEIVWHDSLTSAFEQAKKSRRIIMVCVNAKFVRGRETEEPAAKGLREVVYRDERVVEKSRAFECALLTRSSNSAEFGELRLLGIEGDLVSPQHIFVHPDGSEILVRRQYWSHGQGEKAVEALLALMAEAQENLAGSGTGAGAGPVPEAPEGNARPGWIRDRIREVVEGPRGPRDAAIASLIRNDLEGDCLTPLLALLGEHSRNHVLLADIIRGVGRDKLEPAALPVAGFLSHKEEGLRAMAAVSLEYIGSREKKVVGALKKAAGRERDEAIANHLFRALGRCGVGDSGVRSLLLKKSGGARSEFASLGPIIGLAYFEDDSKAMRGVEKILKKVGVPGGRRGGGQNTVKRAVLCWTLACIGDGKSAKFVREQLIEKLENMSAFWVAPLRTFYRTVARTCDGDETGLPEVEQGVRGALGFAKRFGAEIPALVDEYRRDRPAQGFTPKGEYLLGGN